MSEIKGTVSDRRVSRRGVAVYDKNPFMENVSIKLRQKRLTVAKGARLVDEDGEIGGVTEISQVVNVDSTEFIKIFTQNVKAFFELSQAAYKVLQLVFRSVQDAPGVDQIVLNFLIAEDVAKQIDVGISKAVFHRGLTELLHKGFVAESVYPNVYYINPNLFFNGDRARFVQEYRRVRSDEEIRARSRQVLGNMLKQVG